MKKKSGIILLVLLLLNVFCAKGAVRLAGIFSEGMVLQRDVPLKIWGNAEAHESVTVHLAGETQQTNADGDGRWQVVLPALKAGGPHVLRTNDLVVRDVLIGDVWLCSGQSNMELPVSRVMDMFADEVGGYENPQIRYVKIAGENNFHGPQQDIGKSVWKPIESGTVGDISALCYFFSRNMYEKTGVPVGIINSSVGGSSIEQWVSDRALESHPTLYHALGIIRSDEYMHAAALAGRMRSALWRETLDDTDKGLQGNWMGENVDDDTWESTDIFSPAWQRDSDYQPINGSIWFRKTFAADGFDLDKEAVLRLGCIVDADYAYVNGKLVGSTSYQYPPRIYRIPAGLLKENGNVVAIRVISQAGRPSFVEDKPYKIIQSDQEINLSGKWKYRRGTVMPALSGSFYNGGGVTGRYNTMIAPLFGYAVKGAVWYQGESNTGNASRYEELLPALMESWRTGFGQPDLPFFIIQLPNYGAERPEPSDGGWASLREAQAHVVGADRNAALIVTIDTGEWNDIHPLDKKTIADRLALAVKKLVYGERITAGGPEYESFETDGDQIIISFEKEGGKLTPNKELRGFAIAGDDKKFVWAEAWTRGNTVVVTSKQVADPRYVRYAWADNPGEVNLMNVEGFPAVPFRTDK
jgi:sialate O-acetylesterase